MSHYTDFTAAQKGTSERLHPNVVAVTGPGTAFDEDLAKFFTIDGAKQYDIEKVLGPYERGR